MCLDLARIVALSALVIVLFGSFGPRVAAETTTGTLVGRIIDTTGRPVADALVTLLNLRSGFLRSAVTDADGVYRIPLLPPAEYRISATKEGFLAGHIERFQAEVGTTKEIIPPPIALQPALLGPLAPASASGSQARHQANVSDPTLRLNADHADLAAIPLMGVRSYDTLALLAAGVAPPPQTVGSSGPGLGPGVGTPGQFSVHGQRARSNNFTIDGSDSNDQDVGVRRQGFTIGLPQPVEAATAVELATALVDAEAGRNTGAHVNAVSHAGGNELHGSVYAFFSHDRLNARDFFDLGDGGGNPAENPFQRFQGGGLLSGPLVRDRAHFFGSFEIVDVTRLAELHFAVPTFEESARAFRRGCGCSLLAVDMLASDLVPRPNNAIGPYGQNTFTDTVHVFGRGLLTTAKVDWQFAPFGLDTTGSVRYAGMRDSTRIPAVDGATRSSVDSRTRTHSVAVSLNTDVGERASNQVRLSYGRTSLAFDEVTGSPFVFTSPLGRTGPVGRVLIAPYSPVGVDPYTFPQGRVNNTIQAADTVFFVKESHAVKLGVDLRRVEFNSYLDRNYRPQVAFTGGYFSPRASTSPAPATGLDFAGIGLATNVTQALAVEPDSSLALRHWEAALFAHDAWRPSPRLAVTAGIRYEANTVPGDARGSLEAALTLEDGDLGISHPPSASERIFLDSVRALREVYGGRTRVYDPDYNNVAPRVGLAWDLAGDGTVALRAGYGLYYDIPLGTLVSQSRNVFPRFVPLNFGADITFPAILSGNPAFLPGLIARGTGNQIGVPPTELPAVLGSLFFLEGASLAFTLPEKGLRTAYVHQYSVSAEAALGEGYTATVAYVGTSGRKLLRARTPNGGPNHTFRYLVREDVLFTLFGQTSRPDPRLGAYTVFESSASANYNALEASLERKFAEGFALRAAYTWSHAIDEVSDIFDLAGAYALAQDELGRAGGTKAERADAGFDVRHRATAAWVAELPRRGPLAWLGGVELAGILTMQTGQPYTVNSTVDVNLDGNLTDRLDTVAGLRVPNDGPRRLSLAPGVTPADLLAPLEPGRPRSGSVGRNSFRSAGIASVDLAASRRFRLGKSASISIRIEAFNLFNRSHFAIPSRILEGPAFGSSVSTTVPSRAIQMVSRLSF